MTDYTPELQKLFLEMMMQERHDWNLKIKQVKR